MRAPPRRDPPHPLHMSQYTVHLPGEIRPPGPPGMTPVSVEAVAAAAVAGALGKKTGSVDGNAAIAAASA